MYSFKNKHYESDAEGYLLYINDWSIGLAQQIAKKENIELNEAHWELIHLLRHFYKEYDHSPAMRPLIKYIRSNLNLNKANSIYVMQLFGGNPAKTAAKIAGLPRPENCL